MGSGKEFADGKIASKKVLVISKSYCPFCKKAKQVLGKYKIPADNIEYIEIENRPDMDEIQASVESTKLFSEPEPNTQAHISYNSYPQDHMRSLTGARSVPRVFIGGKCVGGGDEVASLDAKGKLKPMLEEVGAL